MPIDNKNDNRIQLDDKLFAQFDRLVPMIDNVADGLRTINLIGLGSLVGIFIWLFWVQGFSLKTTLITTLLLALPLLLLFRFWRVLESLKHLPDIASEAIEDVTDEVKQTWREVRSDKKQALNFIGQAKNLWQMRSLLGELDDWVAHYINFSLLLNPLALVLGVLSILFIMLITLVAATLLLTRLF